MCHCVQSTFCVKLDLRQSSTFAQVSFGGQSVGLKACWPQYIFVFLALIIKLKSSQINQYLKCNTGNNGFLAGLVWINVTQASKGFKGSAL